MTEHNLPVPDDAPWLDTKYDGFDEEQIKKVLKAINEPPKYIEGLANLMKRKLP